MAPGTWENFGVVCVVAWWGVVGRGKSGISWVEERLRLGCFSCVSGEAFGGELGRELGRRWARKRSDL